MRSFSAFLSGWIFALGLGIAGMTQPAKIIGFLDVTGNWDPTLMFVMGGAVGLGLLTFNCVLKRLRPVLEDDFHVPEKRRVDGRLLAGAAMFGIGWGLSGYCPGPALASLVTGNPAVLIFVASMCIGLGATRASS